MADIMSAGLVQRRRFTYSEALAWLTEREERNRIRVLEIDLIGELNTSENELELLASAISALNRVRGADMAHRELRRKFPLSFAEFIVAAGIHRYQRGNYWSWVLERTELPQQVYPGRWGELFEEIIRKYELEAFIGFESEGATRFVAKFLAHGGIPTYCLNDFFEHLLVPAVRSGEFRELGPHELIRTWERRQTAFIGIDKPVRRFLLYGGNVARDFLSRCLEMAECGVNGLSLADAQDLGLPQRIPISFEQWLSVPGRIKRSAPTSGVRRFVKPQLSYDPWAADALDLTLPTEPSHEGSSNVSWVVTAGSWSRQVEVTSSRRGGPTKPAELRLTAPFSLVDVSLEVDGERVRSWRFLGMDKRRPFMVFDPGTGVVINSQEELLAREYWIIVPRSADLIVQSGKQSDSLHVLEDFPPMAGGWRDLKGCHIDLSGCSRIEIQYEGSAFHIPVKSVDTEASEPTLIGGVMWDILGPANSQRAYIGNPPTLRLPLPFRAGSRVPGSRWRVHLTSQVGAVPRIDTRFVGDDPLLATQNEPGYLDVDLASDALLGPAPLGSFHLTARGPLGYDADFDLLFAPPLEAKGLDRILAPDENGPPAVHLTITTRAEIGTIDDQILVTKLDGSTYKLEVPGHIERLPLTVRCRHPLGSMGIIDIALPLRRLRWAVAGLTEQLPRVTDEVVVVSRDELEQAEAPTLIIDLPNSSGSTFVCAEVQDLSGNTIYRFTERPLTRSRRFSLREALDTIRVRRDARLNLVATVRESSRSQLPEHSVVASVTRSLKVSEFNVADRFVGLDRHLDVTWRETFPVTNRVLRFWPLTRLWEEHPWEVPIPDDVRDHFSFSVAILALPPGFYRVEMIIIDPWLPLAKASIPNLDDGNSVDVTLGSIDERTRYWASLPTDEPLGILERFLATHDAKSLERLDQTLDPEEVPSAIKAAIGFLESEEAGAVRDSGSLRAAMSVLRPTLLGRETTLRSIADLSGTFPALDHQLRRLTVELGILRLDHQALAGQILSASDRRSLSRLWTPLFLALEGQNLANGVPEIVEESAGILGPQIQDWLLDTEDSSSTAMRSFRFQGTELGIPGSQLRLMRQMLSLVPSGPLDPDSWTLANFDWLIRVKEDREIELRAIAWVEACLHAAQDDMDLLADTLPTAASRVEGRKPTADLGQLNILPYLVGATALVERAMARNVMRNSFLMREVARGYNSPREAIGVAVELYTRDLCVMDLHILSLQKAGHSCDLRA